MSRLSNTTVEAETESAALAALLRLSLEAAEPLWADNDDVPCPPRKLALTVSKSAKMKRWDGKVELSLEDLTASLAKPRTDGNKDGVCLIGGQLAGDQRKAQAVVHSDILIYDIDGGQTLAEVEKIMDDSGVYALIYTTFSNLTTKTRIQADHYETWAKRAGEAFPPNLESMVAYLKSHKKEHIAAAHPEFDPKADLERFYIHDSEGHAYLVHHDPIEKFRVMLPLAERLIMTELGIGSRRSINAYKSIYHGVGQALGLKYDHACEDPSRLHYFPSVRKGEEGNYQARVCGTTAKLLNVKNYPRVEVKDKAAIGPRSKNRHDGPRLVTDKDGAAVNLDKLDRNFDVERVLSETLDDDMIKADRAGKDGFHITCPYEDNHSNVGGLGTFCANGDDDRSWTIFCSHNSCHGNDRYDYLAEFVRQGFVTADDLGLKPEPVIAIDNEGQGIDCAAYVKATGDDRAADKIKAGDATAAQLIDAALAAEVPDTDQYKQALRALAIESQTLMPTDVDDRVRELNRLHNKSGVRAVKGDLKSTIAAIEVRKRELGLLSAKEAKKASRTAETEPQTPPDSEVADFATWEVLVSAAHAHGLSLKWLDDLNGYVMFKPGGLNKPTIPYLISSPIRIRGRGRIGSDTTPHLALDVLQTDGEWTRCVVDLAALSKDPTGQLRALGIRSADYAKLASLLANVTGGEPLRIVDQPGRCGDSYVLPNGGIIGEATVYPTFSASAEYGTLGYDVGGTVQGANDLMRAIEGQHRTQFLAALSLSAEVAADMGVEMGGLNLLAGSSGGKTTSLCVATSTRAMGATGKTDKRGAVRSANVTNFAASLIAARLNGGVLTADEIKECDADTLEKLAYEIPNGAPKAAGKSSGDLRKALSWSVCLMMTGEMTVKQHLEAKGLQYYAGQAVRIVDLPADAGKGLGVFEFVPEGFDDIASYANWLNDMARTHYGHHTRALLQEYLRDTEDYRRDARGAAERVVLETGGNAQVARVARRWQTMIGIAIVAAERGIVPWTAESLIKATQVCFRAWIDLRGGTADGEALAADAAFTSAVFRDPGRFDDDQISSLRADRGRLGVRAYVDGHVEYWIPGETELAELVGGQMGRVKSWLDYLVADKSERWIIVTGKGRRKRQSRRLGNGGWGYCIRSRHPRDQWGEDDGHSDVM
ncbi:MAG: DUF927 domain-containing protein [Hyphomicrobiaceae bacterium]|nr:DUF927 domain-containing protein [Hyphomicrobiaceae bacterium]